MPKKIGKLPPIKSPIKSPQKTPNKTPTKSYKKKYKKTNIKILISPSILEERLKKERSIDLLDISHIDHVPCSFGNSEKIRNFTPEEIEESILNTLATQQTKLFGTKNKSLRDESPSDEFPSDETLSDKSQKDESQKDENEFPRNESQRDESQRDEIIDAGMKICAKIFQGNRFQEIKLQEINENKSNENEGAETSEIKSRENEGAEASEIESGEIKANKNESNEIKSPNDELRGIDNLKTNLIKTLRELWVPEIICESMVKYLFVFLKDDKQLPWETFKQFFQNTLNIKILTAIFILTEFYIQHTIFASLNNTKYEKKYIGDYINDQTNYMKRTIQNIIAVVDAENTNKSTNKKKNKNLNVPGVVLYNEKNQNYINLIMLSEILLLDMISLNIGYDTYEIGKTIWEFFKVNKK